MKGPTMTDPTTGDVTCGSALIIKGQHFPCDEKEPHDGWAHGNSDAEAIWSADTIRVRAEALREAADEIHTERRWQVEKARTGVQSIHNYCDGRLAVVEQILRARANAEEGK